MLSSETNRGQVFLLYLAPGGVLSEERTDESHGDQKQYEISPKMERRCFFVLSSNIWLIFD